MSLNALDATLAEQPGRIVKTRSGMELRLRPVAPEDVLLLAGLFDRISPDHMRFRFLDTHALPDVGQVIAMAEVDHRHTEHLLAFDQASGQLVASVMLVADDRMEAAEVAIAVAEAQRGRGVGYALLNHALQLARERGIRWLRSIESRNHHDALEVEQTLGFRCRAVDGEPSLVMVEADLA